MKRCVERRRYRREGEKKEEEKEEEETKDVGRKKGKGGGLNGFVSFRWGIHFTGAKRREKKYCKK